MKKQVKKTASQNPSKGVAKMPKILLRDKITKPMAFMAKDVIRTLQGSTGKRKVVKKLLVKEWLLRGLTLTARQCSRLFGADRLSDIVFQLRKKGMRIDGPLNDGKDRFTNDVHFSVYRWLGEIPNIGFDHVSRSNKKTKVYSFIHHYPMHGSRIKHFIGKYCENKLKCRVRRIGFINKPLHQVLASTNAGTKLFIIEYLRK